MYISKNTEQNGAFVSAAVVNPADAEKARDIAHARAVAQRLMDAGIDLTTDYTEWITLGYSLTELGEEGRVIFNMVSSLYPAYTPEECNACFDGLVRSDLRRQKGAPRASLASFFDKAKRAGIDISLPEELRRKPGRPRLTAADGSEGASHESLTTLASRYIREHYAVRHNTLTTYSEVAERAADGTLGPWRCLDDSMLSTIKVRVCKDVREMPKNTVRDVLTSRDVCLDFDPAMDYLDHLAPWDGTGDPIGEVIDYLIFETPEEREYAHVVMRKWFVMTVALWMGLTPRNDYMPVLCGKEFIGKNYYVNNLLPKGLRAYSRDFDRSTNFRDKDTEMALSASLLIVCDEVEMSRALQTLFKSWTSREKSDIRQSYAALRGQYKRRASFIGMSNHEDFIDHMQGARRFLGLNVEGTKRFSDGTLPVDAAYAQAVSIIRSGEMERYEMTQDDVKRISEHNRGHVITDYVAEVFDSFYRPTRPDEAPNWVSMKDITITLADVCRVDYHNRALQSHFKDIGVEKQRRKNGVFYNLMLQKASPRSE